MCTTCSDDNCTCDLTIPVGPPGERGPGNGLYMSFITGGAAPTTTSTSYVLLGEFVFDQATMDKFKSLKANCYMTAGTGSIRVRQKASPNNVLYENTTVSGTTTTNIESATGLDIIPGDDQVVQIHYKSNNGANTLEFCSIFFGFEEE